MKEKTNKHYQRGNRREFLKRTVFGSAALSLGSLDLTGCASQRGRYGRLGKAPKVMAENARVAFVTGKDRREMVYEALKPFESEVGNAIQNKKVIIKVNFVGQGTKLCTTHPNAVRGVLDFLTPLYDRTIIIGESKGFVPSFEEYGYLPLEKEYNAKCVELWEGPNHYEYILDENLYPVPIRAINAYFDTNNYLISVAPLKTHNAVIATMTLKNLVMGVPLKIPKLRINDKVKMHAGNKTPKIINYNMFLIAQKAYPDFAVLDGFEGSEGNGPVSGDPVDHKVLLAGPDYVAVDHIGAELMGIPFENMGYLNYCAQAGMGQGDRSKIKIIGPNPRDHVIQYRLHKTIEWQLKWKDDLILKDIQPRS